MGSTGCSFNVLNDLSCNAPSTLWSGRRESNPRPTAWKAVTLPLSYSRATASSVHFLDGCGEILELMMGLEPMTSPLPRECSTTELHQPAYNQPYNPIASAAIRALHERQKILKAPRLAIETFPVPSFAIPGWPKLRTLPALLLIFRYRRGRSPLAAPLVPASCKLHGAQGRIRTSVRHRRADLQSAAINHSATCALRCQPTYPAAHSPHQVRTSIIQPPITRVMHP